MWCAVLLCCWLCRWPSSVGVGRTVSVGAAAPCCFVRCFVVCGAAVRCRVLWCFLCSCVVSWLWPCSLSAFSVLRTCGFAPPGAAPPTLFVCRTFCRFLLPCCAGLFCAVWCCVAACCVLLFQVRRAVSWRALTCCCVLCAVWCCAGFPRAAAPCCLLLCRARWRCAVLSCVAPFAGMLRLCALCCAVLLCAVVGCFVPSGVRWRCAVGCLLGCTVVCCCVLCCAFGRGVRLRCAVLSSLWLAVLSWSRCCVLCCASWCCAGPCRIVLCCVVQRCCALCCGGGAALLCLVCRFVLLPALGCCAVPRVLCALLRALLCCAVLLCFVLCLGAWCLGALCCAVRLVSCCLVRVCVPVCCAVSFGAVLCCVASCCRVRCSAVAHCAVCVVLCCFCSRFLVLLRAVPCPRVLWGAVPFGAALCCVALCWVRCAVCVLPLRCGVCCLLLLSVVLLAPCGVALCARLPPCIFKNRKQNVAHFQKQKTCFPLVSCLVHPVLPACNVTNTGKTSLLYLFNSWTWAGVHRRSCSCLRPYTCNQRGGKRDGDGAVAGGEGIWRIIEKGREVASAGA